MNSQIPRTPKIDRVSVGDYYVYTTELDYIKNLDPKELYDELWSDELFGQFKDENGNVEHQGPGVHITLKSDNLPHFAKDGYWFGLTFARSLQAIKGKTLQLRNSSIWIIAAQGDDHKPYWHTHRRNIHDPDLGSDAENVDSTYSFSFYLNTPECGSPFTDLLFAHKEDIYSMPISQGSLCFFDGDLFHKPQLVPKAFGWRYCVAVDLLFVE